MNPSISYVFWLLFLVIKTSYVKCAPTISVTENINPAVIEDNEVSLWKLTGKLEILTADLGTTYGESLVFKAGANALCSVNLNPTAGCKDETDVKGEICFCKSKTVEGDNTILTFVAQSFGSIENSQKKVTIAIGVLDIFGTNTPVTDSSQTYPKVYERVTLTYKLDDASPEKVNSPQDLFLMSNVSTTLKFCPKGVVELPGFVHTWYSVKIETKEKTKIETVKSEGYCYLTTQSYDFLTPSYTTTLTFIESKGLKRNKSFVITVKEHPCSASAPCNSSLCLPLLPAANLSCDCTRQRDGRFIDHLRNWTRGDRCQEAHACAAGHKATCGGGGTCHRNCSHPDLHVCYVMGNNNMVNTTSTTMRPNTASHNFVSLVAWIFSLLNLVDLY